MESSTCTRKVLAASEYILVEECTCGSVRVTIGAVTLRLARAAIPALAATLGEAARALVFCDAFAPTRAADQVLS